jgi:hypothetical protein
MHHQPGVANGGQGEIADNFFVPHEAAAFLIDGIALGATAIPAFQLPVPPKLVT